ncbi:hypothetical protein K493DRAFT_360532 [Basidiobolus meristosporus CBS 931.73]|uniref:S1 motif domain-containing protein n=1 Tax=Basidiobolus meristosporus CBS 931.73 TaxID=1314790 RepID=A0A1Y1XH42_9FUNG|nr:hypothetical protein K493DRAFT_360532 [Basidiobolus meristosporus CBS 931.73]|eukprot:ORX85043.1 hypothetical protein K493DRAFT_360532 [Basidiobolus meristosporus CBS 931.73]
MASKNKRKKEEYPDSDSESSTESNSPKVTKLPAATLEVLAGEFRATTGQIKTVLRLLKQEEMTVPFIARYRKELTGNLTDVQLRTLEERLEYMLELESRKLAIVKTLKKEGNLSAEMKKRIENTFKKIDLEDIYLPFKPKRKGTKSKLASEAGLEPLARKLLSIHPKTRALALTIAKDFLRENRLDSKVTQEASEYRKDHQLALEGSIALIIDIIAEDPGLTRRDPREFKPGIVKSETNKKPKPSGKKSSKAGEKQAEAKRGADLYRDYFYREESIRRIASHQLMAILRGQNEGFLTCQLATRTRGPTKTSAKRKFEELGRQKHSDDMVAIKNAEEYPKRIMRHLQIHYDRHFMKDIVNQTWSTKMAKRIETEIMKELKAQAEEKAIQVFASNLRDILLSPPAGRKPTIGLDPGFRTGVKVAVIDDTGALLHHSVIYPHPPQAKWDEAREALRRLCVEYDVGLIAIGNGTASRETSLLVQELLDSFDDRQSSKKRPEKPTKVVVSEAGASVYSASPLAVKEFPDLDVTIRGAISIGRRLQDPLAELVKIDPKSLGVGQYQHDINPGKLGKSLTCTVEDCVNLVGVILNTASAELLTYVSGLGEKVATEIVKYRDTHGPFSNRKELLEVPRLGKKTFQQCAGFLRIPPNPQSPNEAQREPLDSTGIHPEAYHIARKILKKLKVKDIESIKPSMLRSLDPNEFVDPDSDSGVITVQDIIAELEKPGRDPRSAFVVAEMNPDVRDIHDLKGGMTLEGTVSNVTQFGAFVDIGIHENGLIHTSHMNNHSLRTGQVCEVRVENIDPARKRIDGCVTQMPIAL